MNKILLIFLAFGISSLYACNCKVEREKIRCDYYVVKKHDLKHRQNCINYAQTINLESMPAKASWYYLLGGDAKKAKKSALQAKKNGLKFISEYLGFIYALKGNYTEAKKEFDNLKDSVKNLDYVKRDIIVMKNLYENFDAKRVSDMVFGN